MSTEIEIDDRPRLGVLLARRLERESRRAQEERGRFTLALPGASVAESFVPALASAAVDWRRVDLFWVDERAVPPDHPDSNFGLAQRAGLGALPLDPARVHRLRGEAPDLDAAGRLDEAEFRAALGHPPRLDLALIGVGPDGHVASLFPGHPALAESGRWVVAVDDSPKPPPRRLTVTLALLATVDLLVVGAFGAEKAEVVRAAIEEPGSALPLARAARLASRTLWLLEPGAASRLSRP